MSMKRNYWLILTVVLLFGIMVYHLLQYGDVIGKEDGVIVCHILYVLAFVTSIVAAAMHRRNSKREQ